jgi:hypothetical protein
LELALDTVKTAQARGLQFCWVLADSAYGCSNEFCAEVWLWEDRSAPPLARRLVAREIEGGEIKVSWTNAPKDMSDEELAYMQGQRHWIERAFGRQEPTGHGGL